jgi:hypothetical protein
MKILIAIITCKAYAHKLKLQKSTWIPQGLALGWDIQVFDGERLGVPDDYAGLPAKTKALCTWALENGYTNLLKIDDDAYVWMNKFKMLNHDYAGHRAAANDQGCPRLGVPNYPKGHFPHEYASGGAYWLSAKSMKILANTKINDWAEDRWVGNTLAKNNVPLIHLGDYGCDPTPPILNKDFTLLAQLPDGWMEVIAKGKDPRFAARVSSSGLQKPQPQPQPSNFPIRRAGSRVPTPPPPSIQHKIITPRSMPTQDSRKKMTFGRPPNRRGRR